MSIDVWNKFPVHISTQTHATGCVIVTLTVNRLVRRRQSRHARSPDEQDRLVQRELLSSLTVRCADGPWRSRLRCRYYVTDAFPEVVPLLSVAEVYGQPTGGLLYRLFCFVIQPNA